MTLTLTALQPPDNLVVNAMDLAGEMFVSGLCTTISDKLQSRSESVFISHLS
jgi:hypothetical protein